MNLSKMSEDALVALMEREFDKDENSPLIDTIDRELDKRAALYNIKQQKIEQQKKYEEEKRKALLEEYNSIVEQTGQRVTIKAMVAEFGHEYEENYHIDSCYTVHSYAESKSNDSWECEDLASAHKKVEQLIYYRVYDKYFRHGPTNETLDRLRAKIVEVLGENQKHD